MPPDQVAIWTGENHLPDQGFIVEWKEIDPGADGTIQIMSQQYLGLTPGVGTGSAATGSKGYGLTAVRLMERGCFVPRGQQRSADRGDVHFGADELHGEFQSAGERSDSAGRRFDGGRHWRRRRSKSSTRIRLQFTIPAVSGQGLPHRGDCRRRDRAALPACLWSRSARTFAILSGSGVVINEISYDSGSDAEPWEYVELFNAGGTPVELSGWRLANAVSYTIPSGTILGSGEYLLISQHPAELAGRYGVQSLGPFDGRLANEGETLELLNAAGVIQDDVDYQLGFPWPTIGDIPGRSIQLSIPAFENELGGNWRSAAVTPGAANSVFAFNAPPQMRQVNHSPTAPVSGQDVTITMKVTDPDGVDRRSSLQYQLVNPGDYIAITDSRYATNWTSVPMRDDGRAATPWRATTFTPACCRAACRPIAGWCAIA